MEFRENAAVVAVTRPCEGRRYNRLEERRELVREEIFKRIAPTSIIICGRKIVL